MHCLIKKTSLLPIAVIAVAAIVMVSAIIIVLNDNNDDEDTPDGITITSFDGDFNEISQTFTKVPERIIVGNYTVLEMLLYFGLEDKIVGFFMAEEEQIWDELEDKYLALKARLGTKNIYDGVMPQADAVNLEPDLIMGYATSFRTDGVGSVTFWNSHGCNTWVTHGFAYWDVVGSTKSSMTGLGAHTD